MGFKPAPNIKGRIYVPEEESPDGKKHACPDCFRCQMCSEERCRVCRNEDACDPATQTDRMYRGDECQPCDNSRRRDR